MPTKSWQPTKIERNIYGFVVKKLWKYFETKNVKLYKSQEISFV